MFFYKLHRSGKDVLLAVCDSEILGKSFSQGDLRIEAKKDFYGGKEIGEEVIELFDKATIVNLLGEKIVSLAARKKKIEKENIIRVGGVSHAQIISV